jgi:hypothetical protein
VARRSHRSGESGADQQPDHDCQDHATIVADPLVLFVQDVIPTERTSSALTTWPEAEGSMDGIWSGLTVPKSAC